MRLFGDLRPLRRRLADGGRLGQFAQRNGPVEGPFRLVARHAGRQNFTPTPTPTITGEKSACAAFWPSMAMSLPPPCR